MGYSKDGAGVLFDVDGTLVDTNYLHVVAWWQALRAQGHTVAMTTLHRTVGQGSERFVETVIGHRDQAVADGHTDFYGPFLHEVAAFPAAGPLLRRVKASGLSVVLATSASEKEAEHLRRAIDADEAVDAITTKDDADASKPDPDIVETAMQRAGLTAERSIFVGDTVWDVEAAQRAGLDCVCVLSGGIPEGELRAAGAVAIYRDVGHLLEEYDASPLGALSTGDRQIVHEQSH